MQRPAHGDGGDVRALLGQRGGREQTIATIVSGPGQQHDRRVLQRQILVVQYSMATPFLCLLLAVRVYRPYTSWANFSNTGIERLTFSVSMQ